jgi:hypothetical protein
MSKLALFTIFAITTLLEGTAHLGLIACGVDILGLGRGGDGVLSNTATGTLDPPQALLLLLLLLLLCGPGHVVLHARQLIHELWRQWWQGSV